MKKISIMGARENNLKNINAEIPKNRIVVVSGVSGSGKSSFAFDTVYSEGYRRYMENLSSHAHYFLNSVKKPAVDKIDNLCPAISISQKVNVNNARSTIGTSTGVYDLLRFFFAEYGVPFCPNCEKEITRNKPDEIIKEIGSLENKSQVLVTYSFKLTKNQIENNIKAIRNLGHSKIVVDGEVINLNNFKAEDFKNKELEVLVDRIFIEKANLDRDRILDSIEIAIKKSDNEVVFIYLNGKKKTFCQKFVCSDCGYSLDSFSKKNFSFNLVEGACPKCKGLGEILQIDLEKVIPNRKLSIAEGAIEPWTKLGGRFVDKINGNKKMEFIKEELEISLTKPIKNFTKEDIQKIIWGVGDFGDKKSFKGLANELVEKLEKNDLTNLTRGEIEKYFNLEKCPECQGKRLKKEFLNVKISGYRISDLVEMEISDLVKVLKSLAVEYGVGNDYFLDDFFRGVIERIEPLIKVGVGYLNLNRACKTVSGGEYQRVRIAMQLYSGLSSVLYVLDEPTVGLHSKDTQKLITTFNDLKDKENTILVVEHDKDVIKAADHVIDFGSKAGEEGGRIVFQGDYRKLLKSNCETADFINNKLRLEKKNRKVDLENNLEIKGAIWNNLKNVSLKIPLNCVTVFAGVSGSGKSSLVNNVISKGIKKGEIKGRCKEINGKEKIQRVVIVDQTPIGRSPRSNPVTYTGAFSYIRKLFAETQESKEKGYKANHFSFNTKGGRCEKCQGEGVVKVDMPFLDNTYSVCPKCNGKRYKDEILKIEYHGVSIADVLEMNVDYAFRFFNSCAPIKNKLNLLKKVGLGYLKLGQSSSSLSGGEAQRIKLASELVKNARGNCLYILDEPTVGLHFSDIKKLFNVLNELVDQGNSVFVIEHNLDVISTADWIIELGPGGGRKGGEVVFEGKIDDLKKAQTETSKVLKKEG